MKKTNYNGQKNICGQQIRFFRSSRHMSQAALAAKMQLEGVLMEQDIISRIESGDRFVTDYELRAFATVLEVPIRDLLPM